MNKKTNKLSTMINECMADLEYIVENYYDDENKLIISEGMLHRMSTFIKEGVQIYNYIIKNELFQEYTDVQNILVVVNQKLIDLEINEENAKKLNMQNSFEKWEDLQAAIISMCIVTNAHIEINATEE